MIPYQKLIFFKAFCTLTLRSNGNLNLIISKYDELFGNDLTADEDKEMSATIKEIFAMVSKDNITEAIALTDLFAERLPQYSKEMLLQKITFQIFTGKLEEALVSINSYISKYELGYEIAIRKMEVMMSLDYDLYVVDIEQLMEYVKGHMV